MKNLVDLLNRHDEAFRELPDDLSEQIIQVNNVSSLTGYAELNNLDPKEIQLEIGIERLIGRDNLMDISYFQRGLEVANTVCRIIEMRGIFKRAIGTGFKIAPNLLMTNHHVIESFDEAADYYAEFDYENSINGNPKKSVIFKLNPNVFFITQDHFLDYTITGVDSISMGEGSVNIEKFGWNKLKYVRDNLLKSQPVSIIQHPEGNPKMIAFRDSKIVDWQKSHIQYTTDTQPGSSGSLVANDYWEIIALHHRGVPEKRGEDIILIDGSVYIPGERKKSLINWVANQGVLVDSILDDIKTKALTKQQQMLKDEFLSGN